MAHVKQTLSLFLWHKWYDKSFWHSWIVKFYHMWKVTNQAKSDVDFPLWKVEEQSDFFSMGALSEEIGDLGHLGEWEQWRALECAGCCPQQEENYPQGILLNRIRGNKLRPRHLSTSALGKVLRELRKVNVLLLRSCLQGHTHIFQRKWGKHEFGSCLFLHNSGDNLGKKSVELEWLFSWGLLSLEMQ